jgi:hypothetical protein
MSDNDSLVLEDASAAVTKIDMKYKAGSINVKRKLKTKRDEAFSEYSNARLRLLQDDTVMKDKDVVEMRRIRAEVEEAANTQKLLVAVGKLIIKLAKIAAA